MIVLWWFWLILCWLVLWLLCCGWRSFVCNILWGLGVFSWVCGCGWYLLGCFRYSLFLYWLVVEIFGVCVVLLCCVGLVVVVLSSWFGCWIVVGGCGWDGSNLVFSLCWLLLCCCGLGFVCGFFLVFVRYWYRCLLVWFVFFVLVWCFVVGCCWWLLYGWCWCCWW